MIHLKDNIKHIKSYNIVSDEIKYISQSVVRLKVVIALKNNSLNMKELSRITDLPYSSISTTLHDLEVRGWVYRQYNKYSLSKIK